MPAFTGKNIFCAQKQADEFVHENAQSFSGYLLFHALFNIFSQKEDHRVSDH